LCESEAHRKISVSRADRQTAPRTLLKALNPRVARLSQDGVRTTAADGQDEEDKSMMCRRAIGQVRDPVEGAVARSQEAPALGQWHKVRVTVEGDHIQGWLNELLINCRDCQFGSGKVGLWTKADSVTAFDSLVVRPL